MGTIRDIPLSRLGVAPENVRKVTAGESADAELRASIVNHGLLQPLIVRPDEDECFAVMAGGRRYMALRSIHDDVPGDPDIPCMVVGTAGEAEAMEISLTENVTRARMHPADEVVAFAELQRLGHTPANIAASFGVTERTVLQRLRLGSVDKDILDEYRDGTLSLDTVKAFALTADKDRQRMIWLKAGSMDAMNPTMIRKMVTEERVPAFSPLAQFVGQAAYEKAGGTVMTDLFAEDDDGAWFEDPAILRDIARETLDKHVEGVREAGMWKWVSAVVDFNPGEYAGYGRILPTRGELMESEQEEYDTLNERLETIQEEGDDLYREGKEVPEKTEREAADIRERLDGLQALRIERQTWPAGTSERAGCIVTIDAMGRGMGLGGYILPEDRQDGVQTAPGATPAGGAEGLPLSPAEAQKAALQEEGIGKGLANDLRHVRNTMVKAALAKNHDAAFDLFVYQVALRSFGNPGIYPERVALDVRHMHTTERPANRVGDKAFGEWSIGEGAFQDVLDSLPLEWMTEADPVARFRAFQALGLPAKKALFAAVMAKTLTGQLSFDADALPEYEATASRLKIDFAKVRGVKQWFWSGLNRDMALGLARKALGDKWFARFAKTKKGELDGVLEKAFAARPPKAAHPDVSEDDRKAVRHWALPGFAPGVADVDEETF